MIRVRLAELLAERGMTLHALSVQTGIAYTTLHALKGREERKRAGDDEAQRKQGISFDVLEKLCDALECDISELLVIEKGRKRTARPTPARR